MDIRNVQFEPMNSEEWIYCCAMVWFGLLTDSGNLPAITRAMLDNGMDPNQLITEELPNENPEKNYYHTPMISSTRIENDHAAVESLKILLENGGNPNTVYVFDDPGENVYEFYIGDEFANAPDLNGGSFYGLILCAAYGGKQQSGYEPFKMLVDAPISIFKDYERYWYEYKENSSTLYVIEKETGRRVATYH